MAWLTAILGRFPARPSFRAALNALVAACLVFLGVEAVGALMETPQATVPDSAGLALFGAPGEARPPDETGEPPPPELREVRQTYKILGIICRDEHDRSVFVRDLATGDERIYRVGDTLNEATVAEIHPSFIVLTKGSSRMVLNLFSRERAAVAEDEG